MGAIKAVMPDLHIAGDQLQQNDAGEGVTTRRRMHTTQHKIPSLERERVAHKRCAHEQPKDIRFETLPDYLKV